jgi:AcrR family transcriptional regulator
MTLIESNHRKQEWIEAGYRSFALNGPDGLKVEVMAREISRSKSSFYHFFSSPDVFELEMLDYHIIQSERIAVKERQCETLVPDLIEILLEYKIDLLFNRQLRVFRSNDKYRETLKRSDAIVEGALLEVWAKDLGLENRELLAENLFNHSLEGFYLQLSEETLTFDWLRSYFTTLKDLVRGMIGSK